MSGFNRNFLRISNLAGTILTLLINALSNTSLFGDKNVGEISDLYPTLITPAGYVFSIWGVIYTLLIIFTIYQLLPEQKNKSFIDRIGIFYLLGSIANSIWIVLWINEHILQSTFLMLVLLISLIAIYLRLDIGVTKTSLKDKIMTHLPFSVYFGWITVATIANIAATLTAINWDGWGISALSWTILMIGVTLVLTLSIIFTRKDVGYSLVIVWALLGIIVKQISYLNIVLVSGIGVLIILSMIVFKKVLKK
jgi:hypothetical protein